MLRSIGREIGAQAVTPAPISSNFGARRCAGTVGYDRIPGAPGWAAFEISCY